MNEGIGFGRLLQREWHIKQQGLSSVLHSLIIFLMIVAIFPLAIGTEPKLLLRLAVPMVWIAALLSLVIGADGLFKADYDNGTLVQLVASDNGLVLWVLAKLLLHWLLGAVLVAFLSLLATPLFGLPIVDALMLMVCVLIASPILLMLSGIASALTLASKNTAILVPLIALPLQLPVLIFATGALERQAMGMTYLPILALLLAGSILSTIIAPFVMAQALKLAWQS